MVRGVSAENWWSGAVDEGGGVGGDAFAATCEAESFGGGRFDGYVVDVDLHYLGECGLHSGDVGVDFGCFGTDCDVDVAYEVAFVAE